MFTLDTIVFNKIYEFCKTIGDIFYMGAGGGAFLLICIIMLPISKRLNKK